MKHPTNEKGQFEQLDPLQYLLSKVELDQRTGCWNWNGALFKGGYGYFDCKAVKRGAMNASRASWIIHRGPIASTHIKVCHTCDNRACVNPEHLFLGSQKQNMEDCILKDRMNKGEDRPQAKLTEENVREARRLRQQGVGWLKIARKYGVGQNAIISAITGKTWAHVDEPIPTYVGKPGNPMLSGLSA